MSLHCDGSVVPKYKKVPTESKGDSAEFMYVEVGLVCLGCNKTPCEEDAKKGWTYVTWDPAPAPSDSVDENAKVL